jgi:aminopeptidase YwaD
MDLPDRVIGGAYRFRAWETLEALADIGNRMAGSDGEQAAMETVADALREAGARDLTVDRFAFPGWERGDCALSVFDSRYEHQHQLLALPGGPPGEVTAPIVDVGHGTPAEFEAADVAGKVVLTSSDTPDDYDRWLHRREKYTFAVEAGAAGFLFRNHVPGSLPPTGDVGERDGPGAVPAAGVSRELGARLARRCARASDPPEAQLRVDCQAEPMESGNVSGRLGPETDETVLVTAHHDAHDIAEGAGDNGVGCAVVVEIARMLAAVEDELERAVRLVTFGAEEVGLRGSRQFVAEADLDGIRAVVNCDALGGSRDLAVYTNGFEGLPDPFVAAADGMAVPVEINEEIAPHSDHWPFVRQGVPGVMAASSDGDDRGWGHTHGDTLDKLDRRDLRELAVPLAAVVARIATGDPPADHVDPAVIEQRAEREGHVLEDTE